MKVHYNPLADKAAECPWPRVAQDRREHPVAWVDEPSLPQGGYFMVTAYDLIKEVLLNHRVFSNKFGVTVLPINQEEDVLAFVDPPTHRWHRNLLADAFSRKSIESLRDSVLATVNGAIDALPPTGGRFDLMHDLAFNSTVSIIGGLLGVPRERARDFRRWATAIEESVCDINVEENAATIAELYAYAAEQAVLRRQMSDQPNDLITAIVNAEFEGHRFTDSEVTHLIAFLLVAGNSTMSDGVTNMVHAIETNPDVKARILADPDNYIPQAVEEMLRYDGPIHGLFRQALEDATLGGVHIPAGSRVFCFFGAGSHDPKAYAKCPDEFALDRESRKAGHLAFGWGVHLCIGAKLARLTLQILCYSLYVRLHNLRMDPAVKPIQKSGAVVRGWNNIHMLYDGIRGGVELIPAEFPPSVV